MAKQDKPTAWLGWVYFAAIMLVLVGGIQIIQGLTALFNQEFLVSVGGQVFILDVTTWGWIQLLLGVIGLSSGVGVAAGARWARVVAIVITVLAILSSIVYVTVVPIWALTVIALGGCSIYALVVHGGEARAA